MEAVPKTAPNDLNAPTAALSEDFGVTVFIRDLAVRTVIGVYERERAAPQVLMMDLDIELAANRGGETDEIEDAVDYATVIDDIRSFLSDKSYFLLERLAEVIAERVITNFGARRVVVQVAKLGILADVRRVGVRVTRQRRYSRISAGKPAQS